MALIVYDESSKPKIMPWLMVAVFILMLIIGGRVIYRQAYPQAELKLTAQDLTKLTEVVQEKEVKPAPPTTSSQSLIPSAVFSAEDFALSETRSWGFTVNKPKAWDINVSSGVILIKNDDCGSVGAIIYPVRPLDSTLSAQLLAEKFIAVFNNQLTTGNKIILGDVFNQPTKHMVGLMAGKLCQNDIVGNVESIIEGNQAMIKLSWAPKEQYETLKANLETSTNSFQIVQSGQRLSLRGDVLRIGVPQDAVVEEQEQSIVARGDQFKVVATVIPSLAANEPQTLIDLFLQLQKDSGLALRDLSITEQAVVALELEQIKWQIGIREVTFTQDDKIFRAQSIVGINDQQADQALLIWKEASDDNWQKRQADLSFIEATVEVSKTKEKPEIVKLPIRSIQVGAQALEQLKFSAELKQAQQQLWQDLILAYREIEESGQRVFIRD